MRPVSCIGKLHYKLFLIFPQVRHAGSSCWCGNSIVQQGKFFTCLYTILVSIGVERRRFLITPHASLVWLGAIFPLGISCKKKQESCAQAISYAEQFQTERRNSGSVAHETILLLGYILILARRKYRFQ